MTAEEVTHLPRHYTPNRVCADPGTAEDPGAPERRGLDQASEVSCKLQTKSKAPKPH